MTAATNKKHSSTRTNDIARHAFRAFLAMAAFLLFAVIGFTAETAYLNSLFP